MDEWENSGDEILNKTLNDFKRKLRNAVQPSAYQIGMQLSAAAAVNSYS